MKRRSKRQGPVLVIDVGNTSTSLGLYAASRVIKTARISTSIRDAHRVMSAVRRLAGHRPLRGAVLSSVVPAVNRLWRGALKRLWPRLRVLQVSHRLKLGVRVTYPRPETIGADRLANACGAAARYGAPVIVADFGTALTFDVILKGKGYVGGVIAPGLPLMFSYLAEKTALLPHVGPGPIRHAAGKNTVEAMRMGAVWGYRGLVREILKELKSRLKLPRLKLCATGGYAGWVLQGSDLPVPIDQDLTLRGLGRVYELNS